MYVYIHVHIYTYTYILIVLLNGHKSFVTNINDADTLFILAVDSHNTNNNSENVHDNSKKVFKIVALPKDTPGIYTHTH